MMSISRTLARHITTNRRLGADLRDWMQHLLLDYYAVTAGGVDRPSAKAGRHSVGLSTQPDEFRSARVFGTNAWATPEDAALVNGITAHGLELDDTHEEGSLHPAVAVFPALLAVADNGEHTGDEVLTAAAVGYDAMCSIGVLIGASACYQRGFHPTGVTGALGAAAAVCSLLELDEDRTTHALGLASNMASGSLEFLSDGSWTKRLNAGHAAATGIRAAKLAAAGFTAPEHSFEGRDGFLRQYGHGIPEGRKLHLDLGMGALETSIKFYPCCRYMHGNIDLLRQLHNEFPTLSLDDIDAIEVAVIKAGATLVSLPAERKLVVTSPVDAQFNMPFGAAIALATGKAGLEQFDDALTVAHELKPWMEKVTCYESERLESAFPSQWQAEVRVRLVDGKVFDRSASAFRGSPTDPPNRSDLEQKAASLLGEEAAQLLASSVFGMDLGRPLSDQINVPERGLIEPTIGQPA